jgi:hypothetical protein
MTVGTRQQKHKENIMIKLKQSKVHSMKMASDYAGNPIGAVLKWPRCSSVRSEDIDVEVTVHTVQDALVIPVAYLRSLFKGSVDASAEKHLNQMVDILVQDQKELSHEIIFTGARGLYK